MHENAHWESLSSFLILWALIEIHMDHYRLGVWSNSESSLVHQGPRNEAGVILLFWGPLCHMSGLVRRRDGPCYWKARLSHTPHSLLPYAYLSRRGKFPISVIFYFVMKVSRGCEREEMHHKSLPGENRAECIRVCVLVQLLAESMFYSQYPFCLSVFTSLSLMMALP